MVALLCTAELMPTWVTGWPKVVHVMLTKGNTSQYVSPGNTPILRVATE